MGDGLTDGKPHNIQFVLSGLETEVKANLISEKMTVANWSYLRISLDPRVSLTSSSFPSFNWSTYLAALGGAVGLWLGLGIMQLIQMLIEQ